MGSITITTKKLLNCDENCDGKVLELWRKSSICDENCDGKHSVTISFITNWFVTGRHNLWRKLWRTKVRHNFLWRKYSVTKFCDGNCDGLFPKEELALGRFFVTEWVMSVTNCDGIRHFPQTRKREKPPFPLLAFPLILVQINC